jgi:HSF-type DNA-binding
MVTTITQQEMDEYGPLGLLLDEDNANSILDALSFVDDSHFSDMKPSVVFLHNGVTYGPVPPPAKTSTIVSNLQPAPPPQQVQEEKKPCHPYFYYRDFSTLPDPDPNTPITSPGRIPNFPAKMYAILSRKDLADIITWLPHGRSWRVLKPREFEASVIKTYFEHSKFSSFVRQANGWGFRRIVSKGADRNSYYHELFLRGHPHLIKLMRRPPTSSKPLPDPSSEPDFHAISKERPLPEIQEGDATSDAVAQANVFRQATYAFIPPASYTAPPTKLTVSPEPVKTATHPPPQSAQTAVLAPSHYDANPSAAGHAFAGYGGYRDSTIPHAPHQPAPVQQRQVVHYHYAPPH